ncbi:ABC transporter permease [Saccharomonospora sp. CUA-673]|uniref:ABC transporter permease n=1 Tax=Saccharomonospora sp. CUA-673 TaxID=1904969 RepID=UPI001C9E6196|nr:ABC transporter permease [Saccharomonospora sp. CUA-673]
MTGLSVPSWGGVAASLLLIALTAAVAYRQRLHLTRELITASLRAGAQLAAVGVLLLVIFAHTGLPGAFGWVTIMILLAGQVAGRRGTGLPRARWAATLGVAVGSLVTLATLLGLGIISTQARVVVPIGGMIVSGAMQAAGVALRRLREDAQQARPAIEARLCLGLPARDASCPTNAPRCAPRCCPRSTPPRSSA